MDKESAPENHADMAAVAAAMELRDRKEWALILLVLSVVTALQHPLVITFPIAVAFFIAAAVMRFRRRRAHLVTAADGTVFVIFK
ncbi:hypothetical protein DES53_1157 [Roseimicrobium gellanilyticum]|uniref:Uncharacterized protein n=1 Tax=Roseimicrobium gellanilyticum TaxID=748857 RepID=A0A366H6H8_9BACT|nr:hypothetical protein [Roseimicrobium gellanilyticum]RBP36866.1 hypothetical protein DES53_1157 [Roseimicrobium gellanilyticum]